MLIINNPVAPWIYVEEEAGGETEETEVGMTPRTQQNLPHTAGLRHRSSQSCDSMHKACPGSGQTKSQHEEGKWTQSCP